MEHNFEWLESFLEDLANGKRTVYAKGEDTGLLGQEAPAATQRGIR